MFKTLKKIRLNLKSKYSTTKDWEFIKPWPTSSVKPEEEGPFIPTPPPLQRVGEVESAKRARLVWASRKRGILETDLILGTFVDKYLKSMDTVSLEEYDQLLNENDWDIYYWCTGARQVPERIQQFSFWHLLMEHAEVTVVLTPRTRTRRCCVCLK
jgi:succinate dehydrogenase assembly factor 2